MNFVPKYCFDCKPVVLRQATIAQYYRSRASVKLKLEILVNAQTCSTVALMSMNSFSATKHNTTTSSSEYHNYLVHKYAYKITNRKAQTFCAIVQVQWSTIKPQSVGTRVQDHHLKNGLQLNFTLLLNRFTSIRLSLPIARGISNFSKVYLLRLH